MGPLTADQPFARMMQSFWDEAGGYGARILIVPTAAPDAAATARYRRWLTRRRGRLGRTAARRRAAARRAIRRSSNLSRAPPAF
jgi:hypothetical protein